jgi:hypothetical protein
VANARVAEVNQLKQRLERMPNDRIPELQYLTAQDWLRGATYSGDLKTDDDLSLPVFGLQYTNMVLYQ